MFHGSTMINFCQTRVFCFLLSLIPPLLSLFHSHPFEKNEKKRRNIQKKTFPISFPKNKVAIIITQSKRYITVAKTQQPPRFDKLHKNRPRGWGRGGEVASSISHITFFFFPFLFFSFSLVERGGKEITHALPPPPPPPSPRRADE